MPGLNRLVVGARNPQYRRASRVLSAHPQRGRGGQQDVEHRLCLGAGFLAFVGQGGLSHRGDSGNVLGQKRLDDRHEPSP